MHDDHRANLFGGKILVISPLSTRACLPACLSPTPASSPSRHRRVPTLPTRVAARESLFVKRERVRDREERRGGEKRPPIRRHYRGVLGYTGGWRVGTYFPPRGWCTPCHIHADAIRAVWSPTRRVGARLMERRRRMGDRRGRVAEETSKLPKRLFGNAPACSSRTSRAPGRFEEGGGVKYQRIYTYPFDYLAGVHTLLGLLFFLPFFLSLFLLSRQKGERAE